MAGKKTNTVFLDLCSFASGFRFSLRFDGNAGCSPVHPTNQPIISPSLDKITANLRTVRAQCLESEKIDPWNTSAGKNRITFSGTSSAKIDVGR